MDNTEQENEAATKEEKSFFSIVIHSFFIIPFLIAVFCVLLFTGIHLLTREKKTAYDYLEDVKIGGATKRWQGAFELSKMLANPDHIPQKERFTNELISAFEHAQHDDRRVRQYLALAMGRTGRQEFLLPLMDGLKNEKEDNLPALIYALGMLGNTQATETLLKYVDHQNPRIRSITISAIGNIGDKKAISALRKGLIDNEPNVRWGAALSLARMKDPAGKAIISNLLSRDYLEQFSEVDRQEQTHIVLTAIEAAAYLDDHQLKKKITLLSQSDSNMKVRAAAFEYLQKWRSEER